MEVRLDIVHPEAPEVANKRRMEQEAPSTRVKPVEKGEQGDFKRLEKEDPRARAEAEQKQKESASYAEVKELIKEAQGFLDDLQVRLNFEVREETGEVIVRVLDKETDEVVRQIPTEEVVKLRERMEELRGLLFDEKA